MIAAIRRAVRGNNGLADVSALHRLGNAEAGPGARRHAAYAVFPSESTHSPLHARVPVMTDKISFRMVNSLQNLRLSKWRGGLGNPQAHLSRRFDQPKGYELTGFVHAIVRYLLQNPSVANERSRLRRAMGFCR